MKQLFKTTIILSSLLLNACWSASVTVVNLGVKFDGIWFDNSTQKVFNVNAFTINGKCKSKVLRVYYKFDENSKWQQVDGTNGTVECTTKEQFSINFAETTEKIVAASGYTTSNTKVGAQIKIQVYGESENFDTLEKVFTAYYEPPDKNLKLVSADSAHEIIGSGIKIRGHLVNMDGGMSLQNATSKIETPTNKIIK